MLYVKSNEEKKIEADNVKEAEPKPNTKYDNDTKTNKFIQKEEKHFATFLKPKKLTVVVNGDIVTIKPGSRSFTITVDYANSTISSTEKPEWPESTSYVELMEYLKITKFKIN